MPATPKRSYNNRIPMLAILLFGILQARVVQAQGPESGGINRAGLSGGSNELAGQYSERASIPQSAISGYQYFINGDALPQRRTMLIAHAVMACLVWALLIPLGGILLRVNLNSPWMLRLHVVLQICSFLLYIAAVGLGIFLINTLGSFASIAWQDPHPRLGLAVLVLASVQPLLGYLHHRAFRRNILKAQAEGPGRGPGRTIWGQAHLWLGRLLIALGVINGGLGLRLAGKQPAWLNPAPRAAQIGYAVGVTVTTGIYMVIVMKFERQRRIYKRELLRSEHREDSHRVEEHKGIPSA